MSGEVIARLFLAGRARTKGSLTGRPVRVKGGGLKFVQQDSEQSTAWKQSMIKQLRDQLGIEMGRVDNKLARVDAEPYAGAIEVHRFFRFSRQQSAAALKAGEVWPSHATQWPVAEGGSNVGDVDKLTRNLLDALGQAGVIKDDCYVVGGAELKRWCREGERPGVEILVRPAGAWAAHVESIMLAEVSDG